MSFRESTKRSWEEEVELGLSSPLKLKFEREGSEVFVRALGWTGLVAGGTSRDLALATLFDKLICDYYEMDLNPCAAQTEEDKFYGRKLRKLFRGRA